MSVEDGPALRANFLMDYAFWLLEHGNNGTWVADSLWQSIHIDLLWIAMHWNECSYVLSITVS